MSFDFRIRAFAQQRPPCSASLVRVRIHCSSSQLKPICVVLFAQVDFVGMQIGKFYYTLV